MKRTEYTYGQLDKVLRSLGFTCRLIEDEAPGLQHALQGVAGLLVRCETGVVLLPHNGTRLSGRGDARVRKRSIPQARVRSSGGSYDAPAAAPAVVRLA